MAESQKSINPDQILDQYSIGKLGDNLPRLELEEQAEVLSHLKRNQLVMVAGVLSLEGAGAPIEKVEMQRMDVSVKRNYPGAIAGPYFLSSDTDAPQYKPNGVAMWARTEQR